MRDEMAKLVGSIQASMVESAKTCFVESELHALRVVISLTVEFHDYLQCANLEQLSQNDLRYNCESVFSGIDEFSSLTHGYAVLVDALSSRVQWNMISTMSLKKQFLSWFHEFEIETSFEKKCRLLLDLFKLQIVFAGVLYD